MGGRDGQLTASIGPSGPGRGIDRFRLAIEGKVVGANDASVALQVDRLRRFRGDFDLGRDFVYGIFDAVERVVVGGTGRGMLEWVTAAQAKIGLGLEVRAFYRRMAGGVALAVMAAGLTAASATRVSSLRTLLCPLTGTAGDEKEPFTEEFPLRLTYL